MYKYTEFLLNRDSTWTHQGLNRDSIFTHNELKNALVHSRVAMSHMLVLNSSIALGVQ